MKKATEIDIVTYLDFLLNLNPEQTLRKFEVKNGGVQIETLSYDSRAGFSFLKYSFATHPLGGYVVIFTDGENKTTEISSLFNEYMGTNPLEPTTHYPQPEA